MLHGAGRGFQQHGVQGRGVTRCLKLKIIDRTNQRVSNRPQFPGLDAVSRNYRQECSCR